MSVPELTSDPVSGLVVLSPMATTTHPTAGIASFDLLINGVLADTTTPGNAFFVDTTNLCEGHNQVNVVAYEDTPIRTVGSLVADLVVDNLPHDASMSASATTGDYATRFDFSVSASGAPVAQVRLLHNNRVVAARNTPGTLSVHGRLLGADDATLYAEVEYTDGVVYRTAPITLDIATTGSPDASTPISYAYSRHIAPGSTRIIELPSTFTDELGDATWSVTASPAQASVLGGSGPYRVLQFDPDAVGTDHLSFQVTTPSGSSLVSTIDLVYDPLPTCAADLAEPFGSLDFSDVLAFLVAFSGMDPAADLADPAGVFDFSDVIEFLTVFGSGCP